MYKLLIDTATKNLYLCLVNNDLIVDERYIIGKNDHSKNLVNNIEDILNKEKITINDLDSIICGVGPGSYTGVRMGVTVAKMFCAFSKVKLYQVSSLYMMSSYYEENNIAMIDARRGNGFCAVIKGDEIILEALLVKEEISKDYPNYLIVDEEMYKVNPFKVINKSVLVNNPHSLVPNYLRDTEAERNIHD